MKHPSGTSLKLFFLLTAFTLLFSCAGSSVVTLDSLNKKIVTFRAEIQKDRNAMVTIKNRKVARTGFYYIVNSGGKVVFHPRTLLIGADFSRFYFIKAMLKKREGCFSVPRGKNEQLMIFKPLNDDEIICLSIPASEVADQSLSCERVKNQK